MTVAVFLQDTLVSTKLLTGSLSLDLIFFLFQSSIKNADNANIRKTIPPMIVTERDKS